MLRRLLTVVFLFGLQACNREPDTQSIAHVDPVRPDRIQVLAEDIYRTWTALISDIHSNGQDELLLLGHESGRSAKACTLSERPSAPCQLRDLIPSGRDRHGCAAADLNHDGVEDLYCTTGANEGTGANPNELWLSDPKGRYTKVEGAWGATEATTRGRKASFINLNGDDLPDLLTTAYGERSDAGENSSLLWLNAGDQFLPRPLSEDRTFAHRCHKIIDLNKDGLDDIVGCSGAAGMKVLLSNTEPATFSEHSIASDRHYYFAVDIFSADKDVYLFAAIGGRRGQMFIELGRLDPRGKLRQRKRINCSMPAEQGGEIIYCSDVRLLDYDADGVLDVAVSRRRGWLLDEVIGDAPDLILKGPNFEHGFSIPPTSHGAGSELLPWRGGLIQVNSGEDWSGSVVHILPPKESVAPGN